ncbi:MAG: sigma-70 family RNA polymerase sigma factor [Gemmataceae bacterium]|nr:sigma-70 family RNA polymerase sigma factor [Gemmataceae bacterium]
MATGQVDGLLGKCLRAALPADGGMLSDGDLLERFLANQEESAFAAIVRRHGPMVLGVCRRLLSHHDADDAFQATFFVLVRKAATLKLRVGLANWLYGVAYHTALKTKALARKRQAKEAAASAMSQAKAKIESRQDWQPLLDEELHRLPDKYRSALVLCDLEGKTRQEAAKQLGVPAGTMSGRLTTARRLLAQRLAKRGLVLSAGGLATILTQQASASVPSTLAGVVVQTAKHIALGAAPSCVPAKIHAITEGVMRTMLLAKLKTALVVLVTFAFLACGWRLLSSQASARQPAPIAAAGASLLAVAQDREGPRALSLDGPVDQVAYSPDGRFLATQHRIDEVDEGRRWRGHELKIWDAQTGKPLRTITQVKTNWFGAFTFSHDGKTLASVAMRPENNKRVYDVKLWDPATGNEKATLVGASHGLYALTFSPDSKFLAAAATVMTPTGTTTGGEVYLWEIDSGNLVWQKEEHKDQLNGIAFSPDGKTIATASGDMLIKLFDAKSGDVKHSLAGHEKHGVFSVAFSPDGSLLASGGLDGTVRIWNPVDGKLLRTLEGFNPNILVVAFTRDGKALVAGGSEKGVGAVKLFDPRTGELKNTCKENAGYVRSISLAPDGNTVAIGSWDRSVRFWSIRP